MVTSKPKGLGRGLEALLGPKSSSETASSNNSNLIAVDSGVPMTLALNQVIPGSYQPRTRMDEGALYELAESIKMQGIMQPILVRQLSGEKAGSYEIIAGERRFRAAKLAGLSSIPALVRDVPDQSAAAMALIENIQREDLNPLEEAQGLQRLIKEFGLSHDQAAQAVGRSRSATTNLMRLLNLAQPVQTMLLAGDLEMGHARALVPLEKAHQITAANQVIAKKLSVRGTELLAKKIANELNFSAKSNHQAFDSPIESDHQSDNQSNIKPKDIQHIEEELSDLFATTVEIQIKKQALKNKNNQKNNQKINQKDNQNNDQTINEFGQINIHFSSLDELNGFIDRLRKCAY